jgi:hypothetical protein
MVAHLHRRLILMLAKPLELTIGEWIGTWNLLFEPRHHLCVIYDLSIPLY